MFKFLSCFLVLSTTVVLADLPKGVTKCNKDDNSCISKTGQEIIGKHYSGWRELNLIPIDPLNVKNLVIDRNPSSPVSLELKFKDLYIYGLKNAQVTVIEPFELGKRNSFEAKVPQLKFKGKYALNGRVLLFPISGQGDSVIIATNNTLKYNYDVKSVEKDSKMYGELHNVKLSSKVEHVHFYFSNLFGGDKNLGDNMNKFLNENWQDIYKEMIGSYNEALSLIGKQILNNVLSKYPLNELYL